MEKKSAFKNAGRRVYQNIQKNTAETVENEKKLKKIKKFFKRVWTNTFLCGKLWENLLWKEVSFSNSDGFSRWAR